MMMPGGKNPRSDMLKILSKKLARVIAKIENEADAQSPDDVGAMTGEMDGDGDTDSLAGGLDGLGDVLEGDDNPSEEMTDAVDPMDKEVAEYMKGGQRRKPRDGTAVMIAGAMKGGKGADPKRRGIA
jgi:hypothetical protein